MYKLVQPNKPFVWTAECDKAFQKLKDALTSPPVLTIPDTNKPFELICDASMIRLAAVLLQEGKVVAYESRKLKGGESNYHAPALEALAVVHAFNLWRCYLEGNHTVVYTDHNPLLHLMSQPTLNRMQASKLLLCSPLHMSGNIRLEN